MTEATIRQQIKEKLKKLNIQELILVNQLLNDIKTYLKHKKMNQNLSNNPQNQKQSISLNDSDFIGCFEDDPDLS